MTSSAPVNASTTAPHSTLFAFSFKIKVDIIIAKKGDNLFNILASAIFSRSMA